MRKCKILGWVGQQFVNVYKGVGSVNVNQCQQGGWVKKGQKSVNIVCERPLLIRGFQGAPKLQDVKF